jgi:hypothetical protein
LKRQLRDSGIQVITALELFLIKCDMAVWAVLIWFRTVHLNAAIKLLVSKVDGNFFGNLATFSFSAKIKTQSRHTPYRRLGQRMYSSYSFTILALDGGEWSASRPSRALPPGKGPPVHIGKEAGWTPELVWTFIFSPRTLILGFAVTIVAM